MSLESVGDLVMHHILSKLNPVEAASVACLSQSFRLWASDDSLWAQFCLNDLNLTSPLDPDANPAPPFKAAYKAWREGFSMYPWQLNGVGGGAELTNVLLPLSQVIQDTKGIMNQLGFSSRSKYIVVAASATTGEKIFLLNCSSGQLFVGTRNLLIGSQQQNAMLLWLEEHGRRLQEGIIGVRKEGKIRSINQFPEQPPLCSSAVTNGVKVRASAAFIPEYSNLQDESEKHWNIRANDVVSDVNGEAVIGKFPLLRPREPEFVYQSCASLPASQGSIEGSFTFVPGRLVDAIGSPFTVEVARFPLQLPDYIF